jgi:GntR family transcriptional repressor for pyruvate dehydrogenase complex
VLRERITAGVYALGSRLPSERDMAQEFGVSRATIRQAILALEARGLLEVRDRSGAYVQAPTTGRVSDALLQLISQTPRSITIRDLVEVRMVFEVEMAGLAAERRTREDLRQIARALADTAALVDSVEDWAEADVEFHGALARATANPLFAIIYDSLRSAFIEQRMRTGTTLPETRAAAFRWHQRIFDAVGTGDAAGARRAMHEHLLDARQTMLRYATGDIDGVSQPQGST